MPSALETLTGFTAPALATLTDDQRLTAIAESSLEVSRSAYGKSANLAIALLAAHNLLMELGAAAGGGYGQSTGEVLEEKDGDVSRKYAAGTSGTSAATVSDGDLGLTIYGRRFLRLRASIVVGPIWSGSNSCNPCC